jgi:hypothetical protein
VARNIDGVLLLTPVVSIPERELIVWERPALAERIRTGIAETQTGRTVDVGDFTGYATDTTVCRRFKPAGALLARTRDRDQFSTIVLKQPCDQKAPVVRLRLIRRSSRAS